MGIYLVDSNWLAANRTVPAAAVQHNLETPRVEYMALVAAELDHIVVLLELSKANRAHVVAEHLRDQSLALG